MLRWRLFACALGQESMGLLTDRPSLCETLLRIPRGRLARRPCDCLGFRPFRRFFFYRQNLQASPADIERQVPHGVAARGRLLGHFFKLVTSFGRKLTRLLGIPDCRRGRDQSSGHNVRRKRVLTHSLEAVRRLGSGCAGAAEGRTTVRVLPFFLFLLGHEQSPAESGTGRPSTMFRHGNVICLCFNSATCRWIDRSHPRPARRSDERRH